MENPLLALKAKQIADALEAGEPHPYQAGFVPERDDVHRLDPHNPLHKIKLKQIADAAESGEPHPYEAAVSVVLKPAVAALPKSLAHYQAAMDADLASLAVLPTLEAKALAKKTMIETYWPFVEEYGNGGDAYPNSIAVRLMIWLFDVLDIERGLGLAFLLIKQGIHQTPTKFDRDIPTFVCDSVYDWANALLKLEQRESASPYLDVLVATIEREKWSLAPPVKSKMFVILAKHKKVGGDWMAVLDLCNRAEACNPDGAGVKTLKAEAVANINKFPGAPAE